jgi:hypothetical protein
MTRLRYDQLPAKVRAQVDSALAGRRAAVRPPAVARAGPARLPARGRWRCHICSEILTAWAAAERHADTEHGGARLECLLELEATK